jgi:hypothetical protein
MDCHARNCIIRALFLLSRRPIHVLASMVTPDPSDKLALPSRTQGNPDARVTLVVYAGFQCPYSRRFVCGALARPDTEYIKSGKISFTEYFSMIDEGQIGELHRSAHSRTTTSNCTSPM